MFITSYQPGIPTGLVNLDVDYQNIQNNFQQLDTTYGVDHVAYSQALNNGYHKAVRLIPQATPAQISNIGQIFDTIVNDGIASDTVLYYLSGGNKLTQLTRNFSPTNSQNGATSLPGGLILNWGRYNAAGGNFSSGSTTNASSGESKVHLVQPFPNNLYVFSGSLIYASGNLPSGTGTLNTNQADVNTGVSTDLSWQVYCNTNNYLGFVWWALGD